MKICAALPFPDAVHILPLLSSSMLSMVIPIVRKRPRHDALNPGRELSAFSVEYCRSLVTPVTLLCIQQELDRLFQLPAFFMQLL